MMTLFKTKRTKLRSFSDNDLDSLIEMMTDPEMMEFTGFKKAQEIEKIKSFLEKWMTEGKEDLGVWAAEEIGSGKLVGWFMLKKTITSDPELGFMISKEYWSNGYATEISHGFLKYGFLKLNLEKIIASTVPGNPASDKILRKVGMTQMKLQVESGATYYEIYNPNK